MRSLFRTLLALGLGLSPLVVTQLLSAPTASAQGSTPPAALIVLDASGSMAAPGPGGTRLIDQARGAVSSTVSALPAGSQVGLRVYGSQVSSDAAQKVPGCQDSKLLVPVGPLNVGAMNAAVQSVQPNGWTPIGLALQQGAKDLPTTGPRTIVLVSDGLDTCAPPDPCEVAKQLNAQGVPVKVEAIGFNLPAGDSARGQLQCIAGATGGEYRDAADAAQLASALQTSSQRALRGFNAAGTATAGTASPVDAPFLAAEGTASSDTIAPGQTKYYALGVKPGDRPMTSTTVGNDQPGVVPPKACKATLRTDLVGRTLSSAKSDYESFDGRESVTVGNALPASYSVVTPLSPDESSTYPAGVWYLQVELKPGSCTSGEPPLPVRGYQLQVSARGATVAQPLTTTAMTAGTASTNAPTLTSQAPVKDTLRVGETAWFAVDVPAGSRVEATAVVGGEPTAISNACSATGALKLTNAGGDSVDSSGVSFDGREAKGASAHSSPSYAVGDAAAKYSSIAEAGKYFVTVNLKQDTSCTGKVPISDAEYPIRIMANVAPFVAKASPTPTPTPSASPTATEAAPPTADSGTSPWVWVGLGVVVLGAAVIAMLVVLTKRNRAGRTAPSNPRF